MTIAIAGTLGNCPHKMEDTKVLPINILHIFGRMVRGGAELRTLELMRHIDREKFRFYFCALSGLPGDLDEEIRSLGGEVFPIKIRPGFFRRFKELCRSHDIKVVHSHVHMFSGFVLLLANLVKVPVRIAHFRSMQDGRKSSTRRKAQNWLMRALVDQNATSILAVSEGAMASAWGKNWNTDPRCQVIYNGLDVSGFNQPPDCEGVRREFGFSEGSKIFIHVGRMAPPKNHMRLISIFKSISEIEPDAFFVLVGRGPEEIEIKIRDHVKRNNIVHKVVFAGERSDVPRLLKAADLMIFPSLWEGLPGAVMESCAAGTPILANDLPGIREIVTQFPRPDLIKIMRLDNSDFEWASEAVELSKFKTIDSIEHNCSVLFKKTVFNLEYSARLFYNIWDNTYETSDKS